MTQPQMQDALRRMLQITATFWLAAETAKAMSPRPPFRPHLESVPARPQPALTDIVFMPRITSQGTR
ncbi:MAG: hypothetical protein RI907_3670 [Pseudomonadota bacterium]|jgi:hypothetical protein